MDFAVLHGKEAFLVGLGLDQIIEALQSRDGVVPILLVGRTRREYALWEIRKGCSISSCEAASRFSCEDF